MESILYERMKKLVILTGGGTGGHIYPNVALIPDLKRAGFDVAYFGGKNSKEEAVMKALSIPFFGFDAVKFVRSLSPAATKNNLTIPKKLHLSVKRAKAELERLKPALVFSKGGFASLPAVLAAAKLDIPVVAHESDMTLGLANKIAKAKGATILKANPLAAFEGETVGMPLRRELFFEDPALARKKLGIGRNEKVLLVVGGSLGAHFFNDKIEKLLPKLSKYFVIHIVGKNSPAPKANARYMPIAYSNDMPTLYSSSDVVLSRAGATAIFELAALKKRAIFVPLPKGVSRGDQELNAELAERYGGKVVWQDNSFDDKFLLALDEIEKNPPMTPIFCDSNGKIANIICAKVRRGDICNDKKHLQNG